MEKPGIFIVVEGVDGAGKSTQIEWLGRAFRQAGETVVVTCEPTDGPWGKKIRESATTGRMEPADELDAFIEDRKQHVRELIAPSLARGEVVVLDRYFYSTIAYQGAAGLDPLEIEAMNAFAPIPDVVYLLDIDPAAGIRRVEENRGESPNRFEVEASLIRARQLFLELANRHSNFVTIDASQSAEESFARIAADVLAGVVHQKRLTTPHTQPHRMTSYSISPGRACDWYELGP